MPRPRKEPQKPVPPGPVSVELRAGAPGMTKIKWSQNAYGYTVDQQADKVVITVALRPVEAEKTVEAPPVERVVDLPEDEA